MKTLALAAGLAGLVALPAWAGPYTAEYVFGDSLSDRGNLAEIFFKQNLPNPPSDHDSFTNGPVAVQVLAQRYGLNTDPSLWVTGFKDINNLFGGAAFVPGTNYAVAGATSAALAAGGPANINLPQQVAAYGAASAGTADPNALYVVMIGGNDVRNAAKQSTGTAAVTAGVNAEVTAIQTLSTEGAKKFLVVNVPDVGAIPEFKQDNPSLAASASSLSVSYDQLLATDIAGLALPTGTSLTQFDLYGYANTITADANAGLLAITDTTNRCYTMTPLSAATSPQCGANAANIGSLYFWDSIHPTGQVQAIWGGGFAQSLAGQPPTVPLPAPGAAALLAGLVGLILVRRR